MKLLLEAHQEYQTFIEAAEDGEKKFYIEGIFAQANKLNVNRRVYPLEVLKDSIDVYNRDFVKRRRATGELGHPPTTTINEAKVSHIIEEIRQDGNNFIGRAKILDTPMGEIAKTFIRENIQMAVSTRALGQKKQLSNGSTEILPGLRMVTVDIVTDPSGPDCFVQGIMESTEYFYDKASGNWLAEKALDEVFESVKHQKNDGGAEITSAFDRFLSSLK